MTQTKFGNDAFFRPLWAKLILEWRKAPLSVFICSAEWLTVCADVLLRSKEKRLGFFGLFIATQGSHFLVILNILIRVIGRSYDT